MKLTDTKRDDIKVIENLNYEEGYPRYYVVLAKDIEDYSAAGDNYDYSLANNESSCESGMMDAIAEKFGIDTSDLCLTGENNDVDSCLGSDITEQQLSSINAFAKEWREENEMHYKGKWYNYFDGSNWQSLLLYSENDYVNDNKEYELLDGEEAQSVIDAFDRAEDADLNYKHGYAAYHDDETGLDVRFSRYSNAVGLTDIF